MGCSSKHGFLVTLLALVLALSLVSCNRQQPVTEQPPSVVKAEVTHEDFALRVLVSAEKLSLADQLEITVEAVAPESWSCQLPELEPPPENFLFLDRRDEAAQLLDDGKLCHRTTYRLEPLLGDTHVIPPLTVKFSSLQDGTAPVELESESFTLEVERVPEEMWAQLDIDDQQEMEAAKAPLSRWLLAICLLAAIAVGVILWWLLRRRREKNLIPPPPPPAYQTALRALQQLLDERLLDKGEFKLFHIKLSDVLRHYLEARFRLPATEQTTEEFLHTLAAPGSPLQEHRQQLRDFLRHCDMVKFAEHIPQDDEIQRATETCRQLILTTGKEEEDAAL